MVRLTLTTQMKTMEKYRRNRCSQRGGFTLLEVMIVLFILVTLMAMAVVTVRGTQAKSQKRSAFTYVKMLANEMERYATDVGRVPSTEQGLAALVACPSDVSPGTWGGPYIRDTATSKDPWGNQYQYTSPGTRSGKEFDIWSFGPDLVDGTPDDIGSWMSSLDE